ncbi:MAG TPA: hypothetical protein VN442_15455 [Bryobacteraceae bacterium]|nr:hypothetical protein [Bryobacteraceae bacterium]
MSYLRSSTARAWGRVASDYDERRAKEKLALETKSYSVAKTYDVFLSHSFKDAVLILGVKRLIEALDLTVYVDWVEDPTLDRECVTVATAALLRARMKSCRSLVYAHSANSKDSAWMPWELGYFDGFKQHLIWILPVVEESDHEFKGQEYLGLYPTVKVLSDIRRTELGFTKVGTPGRDIPLKEAIATGGVFFTAAAG